MQVQRIIEHLGYTPNEVKVYLAALSLGESRVTEIAKKTKLPRTSVQVIADKLHKSGLLGCYAQGRSKIWFAENPEQLLAQLQAREEEVRSALPRLNALRKAGKAGKKPGIKVFEGSNELKLIFDDIVATQHHVLAIIPNDAFLKALGDLATWTDFLGTLAAHYLRVRILVPESPLGTALVGSGKDAISEARILPARIGIQTAIFVYGDKATLVLPSQRQPTAVLLDDPGTRDTIAALFEGLWERAGSKEASHEESLFRVLAEASPQPLLIASEKAEIEYVNSAWEKQFGYRLSEVQGQNPRMLQSGKTPREIYQEMWAALSAGKTFQSDAIVDKRKDGTFFNLLTTVFPVRSGGQLHYVQILDDITERKRVESTRQKFIRTTVDDLHPSLEKLDLIRDLLAQGGESGMSAVMESELKKLAALAKKLLG